jgi:membrane fusion protein (multidrug efflux system)
MKTMRNNLKNLFPILISFAVAAAGCKGTPGDKANAKPPQPIIEVSIAEAVKESVERRVDINGTLAAWEETTVSIEAEGRIIKIAADLGDRVKKGDILATVMPVEYEWKMAQAAAELTSAEADFRRQDELFKKKLSAQQQFDDAKRRLEVARASADLARKKLDDTTLRSPIDGLVAKRMVNSGEYIRAATPAFFIVRTVPLKFKGDVPERYVLDVKKGDAVLAFIEARGDDPLKGKITRVGSSVTVDTRSFPIEAEVENHGGAIKPGTFARLSILTKTVEDSLTIPEAAVFMFAGNPRVFVAENGRAVERTIVTEGKVRDRVVVLKGLNPGEKVVSTGVELLTDGSAIHTR